MTSRSQRYLLCAALAGLPLAGAAPAQAQDREPKLWQASLEELMQVRVTTASRRAQAAEDVAAAVFVITRQDIRRSGLTTLPELLRLAPGVQVARVSASKWAISIRGASRVRSRSLPCGASRTPGHTRLHAARRPARIQTDRSSLGHRPRTQPARPPSSGILGGAQRLCRLDDPAKRTPDAALELLT